VSADIDELVEVVAIALHAEAHRRDWSDAPVGVRDIWRNLASVAIAASRPVSAQDGAAGVDGRGGQEQDDTGRLTATEDGR
jgi:hypothetical protein